MGYRSEVIEAQLGHMEKNEIRAAYNRADYMLEERTTMMVNGLIIWILWKAGIPAIER
ncbi:MAG: hypothetical protein R3F02_06340 [Thiolinea sp.]